MPDDALALESASPALREAAEAVVHAWSGRNGNAQQGVGEDVLAALTHVCGLVQDYHGHRAKPEVTGTGVALQLHMLGLLRARIIRAAFPQAPDGPADDGAPAERLSLLVACEDARDALRAHWAESFGLGLAGPCGAEVAAELAHGLRSSCSSILFVAEVLREGLFGDLNEKQRDQVELLYRVSTALSADLTDLTEIAWGMRGSEEAFVEPRSARQIGKQVGDGLSAVAASWGTGLSVQVDTDAAFPRGGRALQRALGNLTLHFLERTAGGQVDVRIADDETGGVRVEVTTRPGDGRVARPAPADPFAVFLDGPEVGDLSYSSPGLRLRAARTLIQAVGGELTLRDGPAPGAGITFPDASDLSPT